jgi:hypothetical protein
MHAPVRRRHVLQASGALAWLVVENGEGAHSQRARKNAGVQMSAIVEFVGTFWLASFVAFFVCYGAEVLLKKWYGGEE